MDNLAIVDKVRALYKGATLAEIATKDRFSYTLFTPIPGLRDQPKSKQCRFYCGATATEYMAKLLFQEDNVLNVTSQQCTKFIEVKLRSEKSNISFEEYKPKAKDVVTQLNEFIKKGFIVNDMMDVKSASRSFGDDKTTILQHALLHYGPLVVSLVIEKTGGPYRLFSESNPIHGVPPLDNSLSYDLRDIHAVLLLGWMTYEGHIYFQIADNRAGWGYSGVGFIRADFRDIGAREMYKIDISKK